MEHFLKTFPNDFIRDFFGIVKETYNDNELTIDFDVVIKWLDVRKDNIKRLLSINFEKKKDFKIQKVLNGTNGAYSVEKIFITPDCFKGLCMLSQTPKAKDIRQYYLTVEKLIKKYYQIIQDNLYKQIGLLKYNQKPKINKQGGIIYILPAQYKKYQKTNIYISKFDIFYIEPDAQSQGH